MNKPVNTDAWTVQLDSGITMAVPPTLGSLTTYVLLEQQAWFEPEMSLLPRLLQPGMHVLDIGANHGVYALEMARCTAGGDQPGRVFAFEPTAAPRARLQRSVLLNGLQDRVTVVPAGLADADGTACFAVQENSELNSRAGAGGPQREQQLEQVQLLTLDGYLAQHAPGLPIAFIKLDAEGDEARVLAGAQQFFASQSPVVMFEFMHGKVVSSPLVQAWQALGYGLFRWSAELELLLPFDAQRDELSFALNLLAVRPAQQQLLAAQGLLVTPQALAAEPPVAEDWSAPEALQAWCAAPALQGLPASMAAEGGPLYQRCMEAVAAAHLDRQLTPATRLRLMLMVRDTLQAAADAGASFGPAAWLLLVHAMYALGAQAASVKLGLQLLARWPQHVQIDLPFAPPARATRLRVRSASATSWLRQMLAEHVELHSAHSSYFRPSDLARLIHIMGHPDHSAEIERRCLLTHVRSNSLAPVDGMTLLRDTAHTRNAALWQGLMAAMQPQAAAA